MDFSNNKRGFYVSKIFWLLFLHNFTKEFFLLFLGIYSFLMFHKYVAGMSPFLILYLIYYNKAFDSLFLLVVRCNLILLKKTKKSSARIENFRNQNEKSHSFSSAFCLMSYKYLWPFSDLSIFKLNFWCFSKKIFVFFNYVHIMCFI